MNMEVSPLEELKPRKGVGEEEISRMIKDMKEAFDGAQALDFFTRMELNHDTRTCWWPGQTGDGRKWPNRDRQPTGRLLPGQKSYEVFPWPGAADSRVPLVEEIINEHVMMKRLALARSQQRIGPRNMDPEQKPQEKAALWAQAAEYYEDVARESLHKAVAQCADISEEYGHAMLYVGWCKDIQVGKREMGADQLLQVVAAGAIQQAEQAAAAAAEQTGAQPAENGSFLTPQQQQEIMQAVAEQLGELILDPEMKDQLIEGLMALDPQMTKSEARRVATGLKEPGPVTYYVAEAKYERPEWCALTPFVDVFYPATTTRVQEAAWVTMPEWLTKPELEERVDTKGWSQAWVNEVLEHPGKALELAAATEFGRYPWLLSCGSVRSSVRTTTQQLNEEERLFQVLHVYYRATALGGAPALYHTVLHGEVKDKAGLHECCEYAHGRYPFADVMREHTATYLLASRGVGEISFTQQNEVKIQRDMRADNASLVIKPPMQVPLTMAGGQIDVRPGVQIPMRTTAGMGKLEPLKVGADGTGSMEVDKVTIESLNAYWARGPLVDPEIKLSHRQMLVSDFLADIRVARLMTFQLVQEFAPEVIRASFLGGMAVDMHVSREEIQGQVAFELDFDVADLDPSMVEKRMKAIAALQGMDREGLMQNGPLMKAMTAWLLPSHYRLLVAQPQKQAMEEAEDERRIIGSLLNGMEEPYTEGQNHQLRLQVLQDIFGIQVGRDGEIAIMQPKGQEGKFTRAQKVAQADEDVAALLKNRVKFHSFQVQQYQENAQTGRTGVEPVREPAGMGALGGGNGGGY